MWFDVSSIAPGLTRITEGGWVHAYLLEGTDWAALVDSGLGIGDIGAVTRELTDKPVLVINTHSHLDHVGGNEHFAARFLHQDESLAEVAATIARFRAAVTQADFPAPFPEGFSPALYAPRVPDPTHRLAGGESIELGERVLDVLPAPGHTIGSICLLEEKGRFLLAGDTVTDRPLQGIGEGVALPAYQQSIRLLAELAPDVDLILPGHGPAPLPPDFLQELARCVLQLAPESFQETDIGGRNAPAATVGKFTFFQRQPLPSPEDAES